MGRYSPSVMQSELLTKDNPLCRISLRIFLLVEERSCWLDFLPSILGARCALFLVEMQNAVEGLNQ